MPFKSEKQRKFLHSQKPEVAKMFEKHATTKIVIKKKLRLNKAK